MEKAGCQEKEKGTGQIQSKETQISWGLCQHDITHKISWSQVSIDIPIHRTMYNVILKSLSQSSGRERTENYQNKKQIKLSCSNLFFFPQIFSSCYLENSDGNIQFPSKKTEYQPMFHIILQQTVCILCIKEISTTKKASISALLICTNNMVYKPTEKILAY